MQILKGSHSQDQSKVEPSCRNATPSPLWCDHQYAEHVHYWLRLFSGAHTMCSTVQNSVQYKVQKSVCTKCKTQCNNLNSFVQCTTVRAMSCNNTFRDLKLCIKPTLSNAISTEQRWIEWIWSFVQSIWNLFVYSSSLCHRSDLQLVIFDIFAVALRRPKVFAVALCH